VMRRHLYDGHCNRLRQTSFMVAQVMFKSSDYLMCAGVISVGVGDFIVAV
jgi:hypothetical protein